MTPANNIRIAQLSPGLVETEFVEVANQGDKAKAKEAYSQLECLQAEDMAEHVRHILEMPKHVQINDIMVRPTQQRS